MLKICLPDAGLAEQKNCRDGMSFANPKLVSYWHKCQAKVCTASAPLPLCCWSLCHVVEKQVKLLPVPCEAGRGGVGRTLRALAAGRSARWFLQRRGGAEQRPLKQLAHPLQGPPAPPRKAQVRETPLCVREMGLFDLLRTAALTAVTVFLPRAKRSRCAGPAWRCRDSPPRVLRREMWSAAAPPPSGRADRR